MWITSFRMAMTSRRTVCSGRDQTGKLFALSVIARRRHAKMVVSAGIPGVGEFFANHGVLDR
jgi:hypothetical protein